MGTLSFTTLLEGYVRYLSYRDGKEKTGRLRALAREVERERNYRLLEPLVLLAFLTDRMHLLAAEAVPGGILEPEIKLMSSFESKDDLLAELARQRWFLEDPLRNEYLKVWRYYVCERDRKKHEAEHKSLVRERLLPLMGQQGLTPGGVARELGLNRGAVWDWLVRGNPHSLSMESVRTVADHVREHSGMALSAPPRETPYTWRDDLSEEEARYLSLVEGKDPETLLKLLLHLRRQSAYLDGRVEVLKAELHAKSRDGAHS